MRTHRSYWHMLIGMLGLMIILAACGGDGTNSTTGANGTSTPHAASTVNTTSTGSSGNSMSIVSFTASGGLSGSYTIKTPITSDESSISGASNKQTLEINARNNDVAIQIVVFPDTGLGSYTLSNTYFADHSQSKTLSIQAGQKDWGGFIHSSPTWTCSLTIASDTAATLTVYGEPVPYREVKGSFSCSKVLPEIDFYPSINLSNGQFDVFAQA